MYQQVPDQVWCYAILLSTQSGHVSRLAQASMQGFVRALDRAKSSEALKKEPASRTHMEETLAAIHGYYNEAQHSKTDQEAEDADCVQVLKLDQTLQALVSFVLSSSPSECMFSEVLTTPVRPDQSSLAPLISCRYQPRLAIPAC